MRSQLFSVICIVFASVAMQINGMIQQTTTNKIDTSAIAKLNHCVWKKCTAIGFATEYNNFTVDCCTLKLPLDYSKLGKDGQGLRTLDVSMTRLTPPKPSGNTLFALAGGPGNAGWMLVDKLPYLIQPQFGLTIVIPDHRGTGLSTYLGCDDKGSQDITPACVTYLIGKFGVEGLKQFSMTNAARDLAVQIEVYKSQFPGRVGIYAASYGTQLLNRFLTIYPKLTDAAVMDGVVHPILTSLSRCALWTSVIGEQFLTYCQALPECNQYFLKESPQNALRSILKQLDAKKQKCINRYFSKYQITSIKLRTLFNNMFGAAEMYWDRTVIPAVIFRLSRCNRADVPVLEFFFKRSFDAPPAKPDPNGEGFLMSYTLQFNVVQSEGWLATGEPEVDFNTLDSWYNSTIWSANIHGRYMQMRPLWPRYALDEYATQIANYSSLMMLSGLLDPATLFHENAQLATLTTETRTYHPVPLSGHVTANLAMAGFTCPIELTLSFLFPEIFGKPNPSCLQNMPSTIDFVGRTQGGQRASMTYLNVSQPFEN